MQIFVRNQKTYKMLTFDVEPTITVEKLKEEIYNKSNVKTDRLLFAGKELQNSKDLNFYNVQKECTIFMHVRVIGG
tara:strand:+ start:312 stop:539 length:228 start_codon:yes stop_codon:yes gene_type:complete